MSTRTSSMIKLPDVTKQELLEAVRAGVRDAMWEMITSATQMPGADFLTRLRTPFRLR